MRVSTNWLYSANQGNVEQAYSAYFTAQQSVTTGKRINSLSDDPTGASTAINLRSLRAQLQQYSANLDQAKGFLSFSESALDETSKLMNTAYQLAVSGANSTTDQSARQEMVSQVGDLQKRLLDLANTQGPDGKYIFAGQKTDVQPFTAKDGALVYAGDANTIAAETGPADQVVMNIPGNTVFSNLYAQLSDLKKNLAGGDVARLSGVNIAGLKDAIKTVDGLRGDIGAKLQSLAQQASANTNRLTEFTKGISNVEDVDVTQAIVQLKQAETAYQAALMTTGQANKFSLLDFIQ
jgi:flagellar hook-associated protein 3 FlgL